MMQDAPQSIWCFNGANSTTYLHFIMISQNQLPHCEPGSSVPPGIWDPGEVACFAQLVSQPRL